MRTSSRSPGHTPIPTPQKPPPRQVGGYLRARDLPQLLPMWPDEIADVSRLGRSRLVARLQIALRRERQRGLAGDWCYDLARHRQLLIAYRAELATLSASSGARDRPE